MDRPFNLLKSIVRMKPPLRFEFSVTTDAIDFSKSMLQLRRHEKTR
jgi:hypothetical protein